MDKISLNHLTSLIPALEKSSEFQEYDYSEAYNQLDKMTDKQYKYFLHLWYSKKIQECKQMLEQFIKLKPEAEAQRAKLTAERK